MEQFVELVWSEPIHPTEAQRLLKELAYIRIEKPLDYEPVFLLEVGDVKIALDFLVVIPGIALRVKVYATKQLEQSHAKREQVLRG